MQCYMPATGIVRITDSLQYIPKEFSFPKTTTEYYLQQEIEDIIVIIRDPPNNIPFLSYGDATKNQSIILPTFCKEAYLIPA